MKGLKKILNILVLSLFLISVNAQQNKLSIGLNYINPAGDNFIGKYYNGVIGAGIKYGFIQKSIFNFGLSGNFGLLDKDKFGVDVKVITLQPRVFMETEFWKFRPCLGIGYSVFVFDGAADETREGANFNVGLEYNIFSNIFLNVSYDFIKFRHKEPAGDTAYNREIKLFNFGLGLQI